MRREENENYTRIILLLLEGGIFIAREILKRETQKNEGNLNEFLRNHSEQLKRRFTRKQMNEILPIAGGAQPDDWDIVLLTGVLLEVFRTTLTSREKRELLVIRNVRDELLTHIGSVSLDETTFEDLRVQIEEALNNLSAGLEPALVANCQRIVNRYVYEPIHMSSSLDHLENMCKEDEEFEDVVETLRQETRSVVDDIIELVRKAEDEGRELKEPKVVEYVIKPECKHREIMECVESALTEASEDSSSSCEDQIEYAKIRNDLEDLLKEIKENGEVFTKYEKGKGLVIRIECKTYATLLDILAYMDSLQCVERLDMIAAGLKVHSGTQERLLLTCTFSEENMQSVYEAIKTENVEYSRSISLSMRVNTIQGLAHVWDMFEGGGAQNHLNNIAEALSEYLGSKITLKASLDVTKFKQALEEAVGEMDKENEAKEAEAKEKDQEDKETKGETEESGETEKSGEKSGETEKSGDTTEESVQQANTEQAAVPRRGVEIVAVRAGTRKTTLFDETISEGERDEISEMGFDIRDDARNRDTPALTEEGEKDTETDSGNDITEKENKADITTLDEDMSNKNATADQASEEHPPNAASNQASERPSAQTSEDHSPDVTPQSARVELPPGAFADQANEERPSNATSGQANELPFEQANAEHLSYGTSQQPSASAYKASEESPPSTHGATSDQPLEGRPSNASADQASEERQPARQVAEIPSDEIPDAVRGAVNNFYRDIVYMTSRTVESSAGTGEHAPAVNTTSTVTEMDSPQPVPTGVARPGPGESRQVDQSSQSSVIMQENPGAMNMQEVDLSLQLSSALDAIGINQETLDQQQVRIQTSESIMNQMARLSERRVIVHHFGSQAEGTAVVGLPSNLDTMVVLEDYSVLQNTYSLQQPSRFGKIILADDTRPGFMHLPLTEEMYRDISNESSLLCVTESPDGVREGSAGVPEIHCGFGAETVLALRMSAWPLEIKRGLQQRAIAWGFDASSDDLTSQPMTVVPHNSCAFRDDEMEWRISTAHVERTLMKSLNIHQRRVFILFRILLKYLVNPQMSQPLSSYMIKNIFLHMAASTWPDMWNEASFVLCLNGCLNKTRQFLRANFLPNFFIQKENLIYDKLPLADRSRADEILLHISSQPYASIASIQDGHIGSLLDTQSSRPLEQCHINTTDRVSTYLNSLKFDTCVQIVTYKDFLLEWIEERSIDETSAVENHYEILKFLKNCISGTVNARSNLVADIASQYISTSLASHLVCLALKTENTTERDFYLCAATMYFHKGMESDALSSRMKFITALVSMNQLTSAREMLVDIEISDEIDSHAVCACRKSRDSGSSFVPDRPSRRGKKRKENLMKNMCSCVTFLPTEAQITPLAMSYEMSTSTAGTFETNPYNLQPLRRRKWAVVDAKVYFGFLNTVLYSTIEDMEMYVGTADVHHNETLMNLLGLFSEYIGDFDTAAAYYKKSIDHAPAQNAVQWYIALLLFKKWFRITQAQSMIEY